jgi:hypothetical protein
LDGNRLGGLIDVPDTTGWRDLWPVGDRAWWDEGVPAHVDTRRAGDPGTVPTESNNAIIDRILIDPNLTDEEKADQIQQKTGIKRKVR